MPVHLGRMLAVGAALLLWQQFADVAPCAVAAALVAALAFAVGAAGLEAAVQRRHAFAAQYLAAGGRLFRLLRPGALVVLWQATKAVVLAAVLVVNALLLEPWQGGLLLADALLVAALVHATARALAGEVRDPYVPVLARRWAVRVNALVVWAALVVGLFYTPQANLAALRWEEVVALAAGQLEVACAPIGVLARLAAVGGSLALWGAQNLFADLGDAQETLAAWLVFLAAFGTSFLHAWALSLALAGVSATPWRAWRRGDEAAS